MLLKDNDRVNSAKWEIDPFSILDIDSGWSHSQPLYVHIHTEEYGLATEQFTAFR